MQKLQIEETSLFGVLQILPPTDFVDHRGRYLELYNQGLFFESGIKIEFPQDDISVSKRNVLRGIHGDNKTWKLVTCVYGSIHLIVVNNDSHSDEFRKWQSFLITEANRIQILIPPMFGNGHLVMSDSAVFHYKQSEYYEPDTQFTINWSNPIYNFDWPTRNPILSKRDARTELNEEI